MVNKLKKQKKYKKSYLRFFISMIFLLLFFLNSCMALGPFSNRTQQTTQAQSTETFEVKKGDIIQKVTSTGLITPTDENTYSFEVSGEVIFSLSEGEKFKNGDVIVKLDDSEGLDNIKRLEIELENIKNNVQSAKNSLTVSKINYQSALDSNHIAIQLAEINTKKSEESTQSALKSLENANRSASQAIKSAELALGKIDAMEDYATTDKEIEQYSYDYELAKISLENAKISSSSSVSQAESSYEKALLDQSSTYWSNLSNLQSAQKQIELTRLNIKDAQIKIEEAEANLKLAEMDLDKAKKELSKYSIIAPYDGIVISNEYKVGQKSTQSGSGSTGVTIIRNEYLIKATISENDISKVKEGNEVLITLDAYGNKEFQGNVSKIIPASSVSDNGIVSFIIYVKFNNKPNVELYSGLTANLTITVSKAENVLYVPIQAVYKENGKYFVNVVEPKPESKSKSKPESNLRTSESAAAMQPTKKVEVTTGINDYTYIEIKSGLKEGDVVLVSRV